MSDSQENKEEGALRYAAYASRIRQALITTKRYLAFSSDVGEAFRPVVQQRVVQLSYAVSWGYVFYDVANEGYLSYKKGDSQDKVTQVVIKRSVFQTLASIVLPAFTIHSQVHLFQYITKRINRFQKWGPTVAGLALVPALPYLFDHPVEKIVDEAFERIFESDATGTSK